MKKTALIMAGGRGELLGVIFGAMSYATINFIITSVGLSVDLQNAFQGLVLIIVILIQTAGGSIKKSVMKLFGKKAA